MKKSRIIFLILINLVLFFLFSSGVAAETCVQWVAKVVSVQGSVEVRRSDETSWLSIKLNDLFCSGDMIRVGEKSRAGVLMRNDATLRFDQNTTVLFSLEEEKKSLIDLLKGIVHFFSRVPRTLKVATPFVNGTVEGTEFLVRVESDKAIISVFEGRVSATNDSGSIVLASGQSAVAEKGSAPALYEIIRPRDAVRWALYYPGILFYSNGIPVADWRVEASFLLSVGRVDEAEKVIKKILERTPADSDALALLSIIAVVQNEKDAALKFANESVGSDPKSSSAYVALSYALQANFDLEGALNAVKEAVKLEPGNALALARLSELYLSFGELDDALTYADRAVNIDPELSRTQTVLGFAYLSQINTKASKDAFEKAIELDTTDPLPRLGMGLAMIREGELQKGRQEIEIAASLDPDNSLVRSYLGKAYYEEKRDAKASGQFVIAEELDPLDPTPFFYDAIRKQSLNRPVEALHDLQKAIELNDNRSIYRSKLLLDEDLAARSAGLARIYGDMGFQKLALVEGWKSVDVDPGNYSAHRFLADSYSALPRHEIARVSELLQSQLLQPINITPVQPQLAEGDHLILKGAGPGGASFNEFSTLFNSDGMSLLASGILGGNKTRGDEVVVSGVKKNASFSAGQFHYESDGFRKNNDIEKDIYNLFVQVRLSHRTSILSELRYSEIEKGDLPLRFDPDNFLDTLRQKERNRSVRLGLHHAFTPRSSLTGSFIYGDFHGDTSSKLTDFAVPLPPPPFGPGTVSGRIDIDWETEIGRQYQAEVQHLFNADKFHMTTGMGHFELYGDDTITLKTTYEPEDPGFGLENSSDTTKTRAPIRHSNFYAYMNANNFGSVIWTLGLSADHLQDRFLELDIDRFNPKLGVTWTPNTATTVRAAVFRVVNRTMISKQTLEPTQVAGFNQFFDDNPGAISWRYGIGIDQKFPSDLYGGLEMSLRDIEDSFLHLTTNQVKDGKWREQLHRAYLYWSPMDLLTVTSDYQFERFDRTPEHPGEEDLVEIETHRVPFGVNLFHPLGFSARLKATYVDQKGEFGNSSSGVVDGRDRFWVVDASIGYNLPKRQGVITLEGRNLFNERFRFQDTDPANPGIYPERLIFLKFTLSI